jgi:hypothetical protein
MRAVVIASSLLLLTACSKPGAKAYTDDVTNVAITKPVAGAPPAAEAAASRTAPSPAAPAADAEAKPAATVRAAVTIPMLAYRYAYALEAPSDGIRDLVARHQAACQAAGPAVCQLTGAQVTETGKDRVHGEVSLKATPAWLKSFRAGLDADAKAAGGRVVTSNVNTEDLSRQIVDTEAAVRAQTTLRDRLQALLATHPGKFSELLEVEQELARVQGELDATQSELAEMRGRVETSELRITYDAAGVLAPQGVMSPLGSAIHDFLGIVVSVLAVLIRIFAYLLPIAALVALGVWLMRSRWPKRGPKKAEPPKVD